MIINTFDKYMPILASHVTRGRMMNIPGKKVAYIAAAFLLFMGSLATSQATPIAFRTHSGSAIVQQDPEEGPLTKEEQKALKKKEREERRAARAAKEAELAAKYGTANSMLPGWRTVFIPGYGYQTVYFDAFGYPSYDILGRPLYMSGFANPYFYRPYRGPVIIQRPRSRR
jgi:hypothetical protein